ncbi:AIR synthase family protein [Halobium salinum]|uniref:AIR synthase family protein n=1 Tax=Halobium salinum TaxID=1364940 RepID=A0ABD5PF56_9EURY|nr:AIR synthase family protein [Halobium salinum]
MSKLTPADLDRYVFSRTGATNEDLLVGPAYGEDAAAVRVDEGTMVVSSDPISLAAERIGQLGVVVASNDVAACGGMPEWLVSTILLPDLDPERLDTITAQVDAEADRLGITVVGGHTESVSGLERPLLSLTCMGPAERYVPTSGAEPGDRVLLTKGAGVEATAVLASDFRGDLLDAGVDAAVVDRAEGYFDDLSVLPESVVLSAVATAMHDPTEGGVLGGAVELARASGVVLDIAREAVPVREETRDCCDAMSLDPLSVLGSGAMLAAVPEAEADEALSALEREGIEAAEVGRVEAVAGGDGPGVLLDGELRAEAVEDGMYALWE